MLTSKCKQLILLKKYSAFALALSATAVLFGCDKSSVVAPAKDNPNATSQVANAPELNAESFSSKGLTLVEGKGKDYIKLAKPQPVKIAGKSEVLEFFWYGCGHCYAVEPVVKAWKKTLPTSIQFTRYPAQWNATMQVHQRMSLAVQALNKSEELDAKIFHAIQEQGKSLATEEAITELMVQNGVDKAEWEKTFKGFDVNANLITANALMKAYEIEGVPAFIVNGKYLVQGTSPRTFQVINKLLESK